MPRNGVVDMFDSTLRDGSQALGISFSVSDKLKIVELLDELGVTWIEAGNPGSNPKDLEFFQKAAGLKLTTSRLVAFGATRRKEASCDNDANLASLMQAGTSTVAIFGKCWDFQVTEILRTTHEENLAMIGDTVAWLVSRGKDVVFDAEHFFDGYATNAPYALDCLQAAWQAGARTLVLCETRGGALPQDVAPAVAEVRSRFPDAVIGIHAHDDGGVAVANSLVAVAAGATGHSVGFWGALWQCKPGHHLRRPGLEDGAEGSGRQAARAAVRHLPGGS